MGKTHTLQLADVFHSNMSFRRWRDAIVQRIRGARFYMADGDLDDIVHEMSLCVHRSEFDYLWDDFYTWADRNSVHIETR